MSAVCSAKGCFHHDAKNCESALAEGITFHPFPRNQTLRSRWVNQMNDDTFVPNQQSMLCSLHFIKEYFVADARGNQYLKTDAIPTEFEFEFENGDENDDGAIACCAFRCSNNSNTGPHVSLHQFPISQPDLCDQWLLAMNISQVEADKAVLCSDHFDDSCFGIAEDGTKRLLPNAVPSIFLYQDDYENEDEATAENMPYFNSEDTDYIMRPDAIKTELPEDTVTLLQKHDDLVRSVLEEEKRLCQVREKRIKLEKRKKDLEYMMNVVLQGSSIDKEKFLSLKPLISDIDNSIKHIVNECLSPCAAVLSENSN